MKRKHLFQSRDITRQGSERSFSLEEEMSLRSIPFPTTVNTYLNERHLAERQEND